MRILPCEQGSAEWLDLRRGKITGSRICDVMDQLKKGGEGASRRNYRIELIAERLSGRTEDHYTSPEMLWGTELEPFARAAYEMGTGLDVDQQGFILHPTFDYAGSSPDGLVGKDGCIEIKCPKTTTHIKWFLAGGVPEEHQDQCLWTMLCGEREWCDFISYDPRLPDGLRMSTVRIFRDEERIKRIEQEVSRFNDEVESLVYDLRSKVIAKPEDTAEDDTAAPPVSEWHRHFGDELAI